MALDPRAAMLKINQERMDVQKALAASQADMGRQMSKKGKKGAWGSWLGKLAAPVLADWGTTALLNVFAPGLGSLYKAAKGVPVLKAGAKGLLTAYGGAKGAEMGAGSVSVGESEDLMNKYLKETVSGGKAMRFDRGATSSMEAQKDLQLESLDDMMKQDAYKSGLKAVGSSLLGDLKGATSKGVSERIKSMRETGGELTTQDYLSAFTESGKDARKQLLSTESLKDWSSKREGLSFGQAMKYSDEALTSPNLPTVPKVDMEYMNQQLGDLSQPTRIAGEGSASGQFGDFAQGGIQKDDIWVSASDNRRVPDSFGVLPPRERAMGASPFSSDGGLTDSERMEKLIKSGDLDSPYGALSDVSGPGRGKEIGSPYWEEQMIKSGGQFGATSESSLLGIPPGQQPAAPSGQLKLPGIPTKPLGYDKMMSDIFQSPSLESPQRPLYGSPITKPTFQQALLMQNIFGKNYYDRLRGGNY